MDQQAIKTETATQQPGGLEQKDIGTVAQVVEAGAAVIGTAAAVVAVAQSGKPKK